jgi:hypothetical protein
MKSKIWDRGFELFIKGERSRTLDTWIYRNRKKYRAGELSDETIQKLKDVNFPFDVVVSCVSKAWERSLELYRRGIKTNAVYAWAVQNRKQYKRGKLSEEKKKRLRKIKFPFRVVKSLREEIWELNSELFALGERNREVYAWVSRNRKMYRAGKLSKEKIQKLEDINFPFAASSAIGGKWERYFELYRSGVINHSIRSWVTLNRKLYRLGKLSEEKLNKLKGINFYFKTTKGEAWERDFELYRNGTKNQTVYSWIAENRKHYKRGKLSEEKIKRLQEINFTFESVRSKLIDEEKWKSKLLLFSKGEKSKAISEWINQNRKLFRAGKLNKKKTMLLNKINFPFEKENV